MSKPLKIVFAILVVWGLAFLVWFLLQPDPQTLMRVAQTNLMETPSVRYAVDLSATGDLKGLGASATGTAVLKALATTDADFTRPAARSTSSNFSISITNGDSQVWEGESRVKNSVHYLRLSKLDGMSGLDASSLVGRWLASPESYLRKLLAMHDLEAGRPVTPTDINQMKRAVSNVDLFRVTGKLGEESIDGKRQHHLGVELNPEAAAALLIKWREVRTAEPATPEDAVAAASEVAIWGLPKGEVWIGKSDRRFRRIRLSSQAGGTPGFLAELTVNFTRYGERITVDVPADAAGFEESLGEVADAGLAPAGEREDEPAPAPSSGTSTKPTDPSFLDSDGDGLSDGQEFIYNADPWNPDTDADGYDDGTEIKNARSPIGPGGLYDFGLVGG